MKKTLCIYHKNCADGTGAAWAVYHALGDRHVDYVACQHGDPHPDVTGYHHVLMVDFSFKRPVLLEIASQVITVTVIDHHDTAERELVELPDNVEVNFDMRRSGAVMAWDYFNAGAPRPTPQLLKHVQDRDLWAWDLPGTAEVLEALFSRPLTIETFQELIDTDPGCTQLYNEGQSLLRKKRGEVQALAQYVVWDMIEGYEVPVVNAPWMFASDLGHELLQRYPEAPFAGTFMVCPGKQIRFSLRSDDGPNRVKVNAIAEQFGGGGHPNAAGYTVQL